MNDPLHIPSKRSPRDVARDIMSDNEVCLAIDRLLSAIELAAKKHKVSKKLVSFAIGSNGVEMGWAELETTIQVEIEERFTETVKFADVIEKRRDRT